MAFAPSDMKVESGAFEPHGAIPDRHAANGENVSPPLRWSGAPEGTAAYAVICHDPDAPKVEGGGYGFVHWVLYGLPGSTTELAEGTDVGTAGVNDAGGTGWSGPNPPAGHGTHHYYVWVLALDREPELPEGMDMAGLLREVEPHLLGMNRLVGTYRVG